MGTNEIDPAELEREMRTTMKEHWQLFVVQGVILIVLGLLAIALPQVASIAVSAFIGWLLLIVGVAQAVALVRAKHGPGHWSSLGLAIVTAVLGLVLALFPVQGARTLTLALAAYFLVHGAVGLWIALSIRDDTSRWVLLALSAVIDFVLAAIVISGFPQTADWVLGIYVGVSLALTGAAFISAALDARSS